MFTLYVKFTVIIKHTHYIVANCCVNNKKKLVVYLVISSLEKSYTTKSHWHLVYLATLNITTATNWFPWYYIILRVKQCHTIAFMQTAVKMTLKCAQWLAVQPLLLLTNNVQ